MCRSETLKLVCATFVAGAASAAYGEQIIDTQKAALDINVQISATDTVPGIAAATTLCYWDNGAAGSTPFGHSSEQDTAVGWSAVYDDFCVDACTCLKLDEISADFLTTSMFGTWAGASACLYIYTDCDGCPDRLVATAYNSNNGDDNANPGSQPRKITHTFSDFYLNNGWDQLLDEIVLDAGCYWISVVHKGDGSWTDRGWWCTTEYREYRIKAAEPTTESEDFMIAPCTKISETNTGKRDFAFCVIGESSDILCDNGNCDTMGSPSALDTSLPSTRSADQFHLRRDANLSIVEVCLINNCDPHRSFVEIYDGDCYPMNVVATYFDPIVQHALDSWGQPLYSTGFNGYPGGDPVWRLTWCIENGLALTGCANYWVAPIGKGTGTFGERAFFAFRQNCKEHCLIKIAEGQFYNHPADYWSPVSYEVGTAKDFAFSVYGTLADTQADGGNGDDTVGDNGRGTMQELRDAISSFGFNTINNRQ